MFSLVGISMHSNWFPPLYHKARSSQTNDYRQLARSVACWRAYCKWARVWRSCVVDHLTPMAIPTRQPWMFFFFCVCFLLVCLFVYLFGMSVESGKQLQKLFSVFFFINSFFQWLVESSLVPRPTPFGLHSVWRWKRAKNWLHVLYWTQTEEQKTGQAWERG